MKIILGTTLSALSLLMLATSVSDAEAKDIKKRGWDYTCTDTRKDGALEVTCRSSSGQVKTYFPCADDRSNYYQCAGGKIKKTPDLSETESEESKIELTPIKKG